MGRTACCEKVGLKKGPWTPEEDNKLVAYVQQHGHGNWRSLPSKAGLQRCGKSCRLRWINYLRPDIKRGSFSLEEDRTIFQLHALLGNKWSIIAAHLAKRTDNEIKNYWNSHLKKRLMRMGIDPITHKPKVNNTTDEQSNEASMMSHMAQWESARLQAEARESIFQLQSNYSSNRLFISKIPPQPSPPPRLDVLKACQTSYSSPHSPSSTKHTMYNMYAITLATDNQLQSPTSTLSFPERKSKLPVSSTMSYEGHDGNIMKTCSSEKIMEGNVSRSSMQDDDIMVAVEAFRASRNGNVVEAISKDGMEGFNIDMHASSSYERFADEYGCWNSLLNLDNDAPSASHVF